MSKEIVTKIKRLVGKLDDFKEMTEVRDAVERRRGVMRKRKNKAIREAGAAWLKGLPVGAVITPSGSIIRWSAPFVHGHKLTIYKHGRKYCSIEFRNRIYQIPYATHAKDFADWTEDKPTEDAADKRKRLNDAGGRALAAGLSALG